MADLGSLRHSKPARIEHDTDRRGGVKVRFPSRGKVRLAASGPPGRAGIPAYSAAVTEPTESTSRPGAGPAPLASVLGCWVAILAIALGIVALHASRPEGGRSEPAGDPAATDPPLTLAEELAGRIVLAMARAVPPEERVRLFDLSGAPGTAAGADDPRRRIAGAVLAAEAMAPGGGEGLLDPSAASRLPASVEVPDSDPNLAIALSYVSAALAAAERGEAISPADDAERAALRRSLGWYGEVAELWSEPAESPRRERMQRQLLVGLFTILGAVLWFGGVGLLGGILLLVVVVLAATGRITAKVHPELAGGRLGHLYVETFLLWLLLFNGLQLLLDLVVAERSILALGVVMAASLAALGWPLVRGIPATRIARDLGLWWGKPAWRVPLEGFAAYAICLPLLLVGAVAAAILAKALEAAGVPPQPPSHPLQEELAGAGLASGAALFILAAVIVPPVEEILFRGVLYRHLREWFGEWGPVAGFAAAAIASSLLFAAVHPQGIAFIPVLASLAVGFCIARELCGSVVPAIIAHGINNGVVVLLNLGLMAG